MFALVRKAGLTGSGTFVVADSRRLRSASTMQDDKASLTTPPTPRSSRFDWRLATLLSLAVLTWVPRLSGPIDLRWDGGTYYVLCTSLAE